MRVRFWGTRGSIATPGPGTVRFGGNTSCVEVITSSGARFMLDCGTGARPLGVELVANAPRPITVNILLGHTHWDHIQGFPFFAPLFVRGSRIAVYAPQGGHRSLTAVLAGQMEFTYFPVALDQLSAELVCHDLSECTRDIAGVRVSTHYLNHPAVTLGYRIEADGIALVYLCDHEPFSTTLWRAGAEPGKLDSILHAGDRGHAQFMQGADLVIHDAQYTPEEYAAKKNWGHSTYEYAVELAAAADVRRLALMHHDPSHDDAFLARMEESVRKLAADRDSSVEVMCAYEGWDITLTSGDATPASISEPAAAPPAVERPVLVVDDDPDLRVLARRALAKHGFAVLEAANGLAALRMAQEHKPALIILDVLMPEMDGLEVLRRLRKSPGTARIPVLILTSLDDEPSVGKAFDLGCTDYLSKPFTMPQLASRVHACLARDAVT
jgi:CheY-like chemotaxis protein